DVGGARGDQCRAARRLDLDQAHAAHANRVHSLVPAEAGDVGAGVLGGLDQQLAGRDLALLAVDGDRDHLTLAHATTSAWARDWGKGQPPLATWASTSSRK